MTDTKLNIVLGVIDKTKGALGGITKTMGGLGKMAAKGLAVGLGATAAGIGAVATGVAVLAKNAAQLGPITDAFENYASGFEGGADAMLEALKTSSNGLISNTELMKNFNTASQLVSKDFAATLPDAMEYLGKVAGATGQDLGYLMESLTTGVGRLSPMILDNLGIQMDMTAAMEAWAEANGVAVEEMTKTDKQMAVAAQVMEKLKANTEGLQGIEDPFKQMSVSVTNMKDKLSAAIGPVVLPLVQKLADGISKFVESDQFQEWIANAVTWLETKFIPLVRELWNWLATNLPPAIAKLSAFWKNTLQPALQAVWSFLSTKVFPALRQLWDWLSTNIPAALETLRSLWENNWGNIRSIFEGVLNAIRFVFNTFKAAFEGDWVTVGKNVRHIIDTAWDAIREAVRKLFDKVVNTIRNIDWIELGKSIIRGIGEGIGAMKDWLINAAKSVAQAVLDFFKGFFMSESPSKLMEIEVGLPIAQGIIAGMRKGMASMDVSMRPVLQNVVRTVPYMMNEKDVFGLAMSQFGGGPTGPDVTVVNFNSPVISFADEYELRKVLEKIKVR